MDNDHLQKTLGASLRAARERMGLTQAEVARRATLAANVYGRIERGLMLPAVPTLRRLALALGISSDVLLSLQPGQVAPSLEQLTERASEAHQAGARRQLLSLVRAWPEGRVRRLVRAVRLLLENGEEDV